MSVTVNLYYSYILLCSSICFASFTIKKSFFYLKKSQPVIEKMTFESFIVKMFCLDQLRKCLSATDKCLSAMNFYAYLLKLFRIFVQTNVMTMATLAFVYLNHTAGSEVIFKIALVKSPLSSESKENNIKYFCKTGDQILSRATVRHLYFK